jgi:hypothetical protein
MEPQAAFFIRYLPLKILLSSMGEAVLPAYLGSTLRGAIGQSLRRDAAAFNYLYNNRTLSNNGQDIINPYIMVPPAINASTYHAGGELSFHIFLLGEAERYAQALIDALHNAEKLELGASRYPFQLKEVTHALDQRVIWQDGIFYAGAARSAVLPYRSLPDVRKLTIQTLSPLRIRRNGALLETVDFPTIIRNITNRVGALASRYGGWMDAAEAERIQALSLEIPTVQNCLELMSMTRYSNRMGEKMDFSGLVGSLQFEGELTPFVPWLYAAQILHIGRNTTFGMGGIDVKFI